METLDITTTTILASCFLIDDDAAGNAIDPDHAAAVGDGLRAIARVLGEHGTAWDTWLTAWAYATLANVAPDDDAVFVVSACDMEPCIRAHDDMLAGESS